MSDLITDEVFTDGQSNINAANMNGIIGLARVQPDVIGNKAVSATMNVADQFLVLKTDNTLARAQFSTLVNSTASALTLASTTQNGMLRQVSGNVTDFVDGTNNCQPLSNLLPAGVVAHFAGPNIPTGWLYCDGRAVSRTTYANLYAAIGGYYGSGDGSTTFNVPNCVSRVVAHYAGLAATGGASQVSLGIGNLPNHTHPITDVAHSHGASASDSGHTHTYNHPAQGGPTWGGTGWTNLTDTTSVGYANISVSIAASGTGLSTTQGVSGAASAAFSILPPYISMYYIIKY